MSNKVWFITGCASGFGLALAKAALADALGLEVALCGTRKRGKAWD